MSQLARRIREYMTRRGIQTVTDLARAIDERQRTVANWLDERRDHEPPIPPSALKRICEVLGCSSDDLLQIEIAAPSPDQSIKTHIDVIENCTAQIKRVLWEKKNNSPPEGEPSG